MDTPSFQIPWQILPRDWVFLLAMIVFLAIILGALRRLYMILKLVTDPIKQFIGEHNVMWEDYNIRTGGDYRRATGRGSPPEPCEFHDHG